MKKRFCAIVLAVTTVTMCLTGCGGSADKKDSENNASGESAQYNWKMAVNSAKGDNAFDAAEIFAQRINEITDGKVKVQLYGGASLGSTSEVLEGMSYGVADIMCESIGTLSSFTDLANIDAIPYLYSNYDHFMKVWHSDLGAEIKNTIGDAAGFKLLGATFRGPRVVSATKKMENVEDFSGFKLRSPNLDVYIKTWQWMKAAPTPLPVGEVYTALQQGTVEGQENPMGDSINYAFNEVCKYWMKTNHVYSCNLFIMEQDYFKGLPEDIQMAVEEAATYAGDKISEKQVEKEAEAEHKLIDFGCEVVDIDIDAFSKHFDGFVDKNYPDLTDWANRIKAMNKGV